MNPQRFKRPVIIIDTNVISEAMKPAPCQLVIDWLNKQETAALYLTAVTIGEVSYGLCTLPQSKRRRRLQDVFERLIVEAFANRVLVFDEAAARVYGQLMAQRREQGRPLSLPDGQIASIARIRGFAVATRNVHDFEDCAIEIINPFPQVSQR